MAKKEVKNPRKPATKKVSKVKQVVEDHVNPEVKKEGDGEELDPQNVIKEFTEATKELDNIVSSENPMEALKEELKKAEEVQEKLEEQIKEKEEKIYGQGGTRTWNGVSDGWYGY